MLLEGIQSEDLCKIRSGAGNKTSSGVDTENKLTGVYKNKYRIHLDHQILTDHDVFFPQGLYNGLVFEVTLAPATQVVKGSDANKLAYKLTNIQLQYKTICCKSLAEEATSVYSSGKSFAYDLVMRPEVLTFAKGTDASLNFHVNHRRRSLKGILLLFIEPYTPGTKDSEKILQP